MNIDQTIEQVEKLYQRIAGHEMPSSSVNSHIPVNGDVSPAALLDMRMTQLLQVLADPAVQMRLQPFSPAVSVWEAEDRIVICLEAAGANKTEIDITVREGMLIVSGARQSVAPVAAGCEPRLLEIPTGAFQRVIALPVNYSGSEIKSDLRNGILEITLIKGAAASTTPSTAKKGKGSLQ